MNQRFLSLSLAATVSALAVAACGDPAGDNPARLYLWLLDSELNVQLVEEKPDPF